MGKYFGTDGIRGVVNVELDAYLAFRVGRAVAYALSQQTNHRAKILIGKDTRISSDMLESALIAGICSSGSDVESLGVIPTPAVAYLTIKHKADAGIVISASHNPYEHNGIKIFAGNGYKLSDELEARIEEYIDHEENLPRATHDKIGHVLKHQIAAVEEYTDYLADTIQTDLSDLRVVIDCANGAASTTIARLCRKLELNASIRYYEPDGCNINHCCGSTHLDALKRLVVDGGYDLGIAFDGDADRCLIVDDKGETLDGDRIMAVCAAQLKKHHKLRHNAFVATILSNMGLHAYAKERGMTIVCSDVGDRYVLEKMLENGYILGGEQSGHIIFLEYATTGDGELTALQFLKTLKDSGKRASEIASEVVPWPQVMINVKVPTAVKYLLSDRPEVQDSIKKEQETLGQGRILVRPSGTEPLVRVMVEGIDKEQVDAAANNVANVIRSII